ncbi:tetratricopeptide repeat protein 29 [Leuresthes tenuis]|uniref:tetratricopeptide repeat protein 29 n=1 Tax=Leuresthes tenuis TaxID=355514 RepID=UPI003B50EE15
MNAAEAPRPHELLLPEIKTNSNNSQRSPQLSRRRLPKAFFRTSGVSDESPPLLSKKDIALFRNSPKQYICVELLQDGYHRSFSEVFSLLCLDQDRRVTPELESASSLTPPLEEQQDKLETMKLHLSRAEQAERTGSWTIACEERLLLGRYFSAPEDVWVSLYFYHSCADREHGGRSRPATEALACLADIYVQQDDLEQARQQAELCLKQAEDGGWLDSSGLSLRLRACQVLGKIYSWLADAPMAAADYNMALKLLHKACSMAAEFTRSGRKSETINFAHLKETQRRRPYRLQHERDRQIGKQSGENKLIEGEAVFRLGLTYQSSGDQDKAKQFFNTCIKIYSSLEDAEGLVKTYKAMAKSLESEGKIDETLQCLEKSADISRSSGLQNKLADICLTLGNIYYNTSQYVRAYDYFLQGYEVACHTGDLALLQKAQVMVGSTCAVPLIRKYSYDMESASSTALKRLVAWKETRGHQDLSADPAK